MARSDIVTRMMVPDDVPGLQALLHRCYGETYFDGLYYDADALRQAISDQSQYSAIGFNESGEVVAHIGLRRPQGSLTADSSMAIVDPRYRGQGLLVRIGAALAPIYEELALCGLYLQAVTVHPYTQQASLKGGSGVTGIYLGYIPQGTTFLELDSAVSTEPTPALILLQPLAEAPTRKIALPERYQSALAEAIRQCGLRREPGAFDGGGILAAKSSIRVHVKRRQGVAYLWVDQVGDHLIPALEDVLSGLVGEELRALFLQLPLDWELSDETLDAIRAAGFFYAGYLPEYACRDWLTLQRVREDALDLSNVILASPACHQLLEFILSDRGGSSMSEV